MRSNAWFTRTFNGRRGANAALPLLLTFSLVLYMPPMTNAETPDALEIVRRAQDQIISVVDRVAPAVVCVYDQLEQGGGSGVIIDPNGYGLTNYHVIAGLMSTRRGRGGLSDGKLYDLEVLGIDPTGDVAMFRLLGRDEFPSADLGDSDRVRVGDTAIAMGNPFTLSEDYTPTVTTGLVTGVHRYQWGVGNNLIYSDCIQTDAAINPGNSGGPLFNARGEVIGINGRISVNTRGRFNVGHGYAISSNQIRRFMPALRAGLLAKHGTLQATVVQSGDGVVFDNVRTGLAADRAGVRIGDRLRFLDGVPIDTPNRFASVTGTFPEDWTVTLTVERDGELLTLPARFDAFEPKLPEPFAPDGETVGRAVSRVLERYRRALGDAGDDGQRPREMRWTVSRVERSSAGTDNNRESRFLVEWSQGHPLVMRQLDKEGTARRFIEVTADAAKQRLGSSAEAFDLSPDESMVLRALYVGLLQISGLDAFDSEALTHAGGDALPVEWTLGARRGSPGVMEVLRAPVGEGFTGDFGFDDATGILASIHVTDNVSGTSALVTLHDYRMVGGIQWPTTIRTDFPRRTCVDQISEISVSP